MARNSIIRFSITFLLYIILINGTKAQSYSELGLMGGVTSYMGDLNPYKPFSMVSPAGGLLYRYNFNSRVAVGLNALYGKVKSDDSITKADLDRGLNFESNIYEIGAVAEVNFFRYFIGSQKHRITSYIFGGANYFFFKPYGNINGEKIELRPLYTEGQALPEINNPEYSLSSYAISFGMGMKYSLSKYFGLRLEWGMRKTGTDYLDDVSKKYYLNLKDNPTPEITVENLASDPHMSHNLGMQRGNSKNNDWYSFAGVALTISLDYFKREKCITPQKYGYY